MTALRAALATALTSFDWSDVTVTKEVTTAEDAPQRVFESSVDADAFADAILSDSALRAALTEAIAEAFAKEHGWEEGYRITVVGAPEALDSMAAAIVARMLDLPPGWSRPHATGLA